MVKPPPRRAVTVINRRAASGLGPTIQHDSFAPIQNPYLSCASVLKRSARTLGTMSRSSEPSRTKRGRGGIRLPAARRGLQSSEPEEFSRSKSLSRYSTDVVPESLWYCSDFRLAASLVIIQPSSGRLVLVHDTARNYWFLPRGRKDVGESLEQAALREGFEEVRPCVAYKGLY